MPLLDGVEHTADQVAHFDVAADGTMAYLPAGDYEAAVRRVTWIDRSGQEAAVGLEARPYVGAALSPDGSRIALAIREQGDTDIWIATPSRQTMTQLTAEPANETRPVWSPDGQSIVFQSDRAGTDIYRRDAQGAGQAERLTEQGVSLEGPHSITPDGRVILFGLRSSIAAVTPPSTEAHTLVSGTATMTGSARLARWTIPRVSIERIGPVRGLGDRVSPETHATVARVDGRRNVAALGTRQP